MKIFYITTPIYYVNGQPHMGHAYTSFVADALARFHRLRGNEVCLSTGVDENSQTNIQAMQKLGETDVTAYLDRMAAEWKRVWKILGIMNTDFIRTTDQSHARGVHRFWNAVLANGDIYKGRYEGWYCTGCEAYKPESDLVNGACTLHSTKPLDRLQEENYFFRLTRYREALLHLYETQPTFVFPESRRNEIRSYVTSALSDISVSRPTTNVTVGIPVPGDDTQRVYVWFDALINYLTVIGYGTDAERFRCLWPVQIQLMGKDILKFHAALWPAMLMSAAAQDPLLRDAQEKPLLPERIIAHGFMTVDGKKMSKTLGNGLDPMHETAQWGTDAIRYFLMREIPFGEDGDFSYARLAERYKSDLGNTLGNLVQRVLAMSHKYANGRVPHVDLGRAASSEVVPSAWAGRSGLEELQNTVARYYADVRCDVALEAIWNGVGSTSRSGLLQANKYIEETQPFKRVQTDPESVAHILYALLEACRWYAWMIAPAMPMIADQMLTQLGLDPSQEWHKGWKRALQWGGMQFDDQLGEQHPLFPRRTKE